MGLGAFKSLADLWRGALGSMGLIQELSARKDFEKEARLHALLLRAVMNGGKHGIVTTNPKKEISMYNRAAEQIFGYDAAHFMGKPIGELVNTVYVRSELEKEADRLGRESGKTVSLRELFLVGMELYGTYEREWTMIRGDGSKKSVLMSLTPMLDGNGMRWDENGMPHGNIGIYQDITERKEIELLKNEFISTVSHELRTPLTSIRAVLGLMAAEAVPPEKSKELVQIAYQNSERLVLLVNDILDVESMESGQIQLHTIPVNASEIIQQAIEINAAYTDKFRMQVVRKEITPNARVKVDPDRLTQVLTNLISNAAKYSTPDSEIWLSADCKEGMVHFRVQDFGSGIPEDFRSKIFERFSRADSSDTRQHLGNGLGLYISKKLVESMRGSIGFETETGSGTTVFFDLPQFLD